MSTSIDDSKAAKGEPPKHVAIIMDGNNRWAKKRLLPGVAGHKAGVKAVRSVVETSIKEGIKTLTLFAFSSENWRRPQEEVNALMQLFLMALRREVKKLHKNNISLRIMGDVSGFSEEIQQLIAEAEKLTANNTQLNLVIAANYGGQWDICQAARCIAKKVANNEISLDEIDEKLFHQYTQLADLEAPDLMIRTGGEKRISNFMLWQNAYSEFYFCDDLWPDFKAEAYQKALLEFARRTRRFGGTDEQNSTSKNDSGV